MVDSLVRYELPCIIVDDGSHKATRRELDRIISRYEWVEVVHHEVNRGRGAALRTLYQSAADRGYTHVVQLDADGQHESSDVPRFLDAAKQDPAALILGAPVFDDSAPFHRLYGRKLSQVIVWFETLSLSVRDPLCGFRCIPLGPALEVLEGVRSGDRMDFDPELIIRMVRSGSRVVNLPTQVIYPVHGISHFRMFSDNVKIALTYLRLSISPLSRISSSWKPGRARR
ncbi:glycosyltransferase family 2 protein [Myxococcota bacterium]|nr:glycosyltransferase family 2 protein [Myxococcota bacterium]